MDSNSVMSENTATLTQSFQQSIKTEPGLPSLYDEVLEVLNIFKCDLSDGEYESIVSTLHNFQKQNHLSFQETLNEVFSEVVSSGDQRKIINFFRTGFSKLTSIEDAKTLLLSWDKRHLS